MWERLEANSKEYRLHEPSEEKPWAVLPCRIWTSALDGGGYGKLNVKVRQRYKEGKLKGRRKSKAVRAHRMALAEWLGIPVARLNHVAHMCDNKPCIEPTHLRSWTRAENMRDMVSKGRGRHQFGSSERSNTVASRPLAPSKACDEHVHQEAA